jgi:uncharacterized protein (TIGR03000 family)
MPTENDIPGFDGVCNFSEVIYAGEYELENNVWGVSTSNPTQCIYTTPTGISPKKYAWSWHFPYDGTDTVKAYPEIIFGRKPWANHSTTTLLPRLVSPVPMIEIQFDASIQGSGRFNSAFEIWLTGVPTGGQANIKTEVMFWIGHQGGINPAGWSNQSNTLADGRSFTLWEGNVQSWRYIAFVFNTPFTSGTINFGLYLQYLLDQGMIKPNHYLASLEFGNEVVHGEGKTILHDYRVTMDAAPTPVQPVTVSVATIIANVPASAILYFNNFLTQSTGVQRVFHSTPLEPGSDYEFQVRAVWGLGDETKTIIVRAGETTTVTFG